MVYESITSLNLLKSNIGSGVQLGFTDRLSSGNSCKVIGYTKVGCLKTLDNYILTLRCNAQIGSPLNFSAGSEYLYNLLY